MIASCSPGVKNEDECVYVSWNCVCMNLNVRDMLVNSFSCFGLNCPCVGRHSVSRGEMNWRLQESWQLPGTLLHDLFHFKTHHICYIYIWRPNYSGFFIALKKNFWKQWRKTPIFTWLVDVSHDSSTSGACNALLTHKQRTDLEIIVWSRVFTCWFYGRPDCDSLWFN